MIAVAFTGLFGIAVAVAVVVYKARPRFPETVNKRGLKVVTGLVVRSIDLVSDIGGWIGFSSINIKRALYNALSARHVHKDNVKFYTTTMDGVEVIVFTPVGKSDVLSPGIVYYHGGGWMLQSAAQYIMLCQELAAHTQSVIVSVNYRKAPEYLYPIPLEDCLTATRYFLRNAEKYGVDKNNVGVKGDSAGGNLAMAVSLKLSKENDIPKLKFMSLDYPALQVFDFHLPCYRKYDNGPGLLTKKMMLTFWLSYAFGNVDHIDMFSKNNHLTKELRESKYAEYVNSKLLPIDIRDDISNEVKEDDEMTKSLTLPEYLTEIIVDPLFAPLMASDDDLKLLPRTYVFSVEFDVLRDDSFILAQRMKKLGLDVTHRHLSTEGHGYFSSLAADPTVVHEIRQFATFFNETVVRYKVI